MKTAEARSFLKKTPFSRRMLYALTGFIIVTILSVALNDSAQKSIETHIELKILFASRAFLGLEPPATKQINILLFDDRSFGELGHSELSFEELRSLLEKILACEPKAIFINKIFGGNPYPIDASSISTLPGLNRSIPIISGAFIAKPKDQSRAYIDPASDLLKRSILPISPQGPKTLELTKYEGKVYGPVYPYSSLVTGIGNLAFDADSGEIAPLVNIGEDRIFMTFPLLLSGKVEILANGIAVDDHRMPLNDRGLITPNFLPLNSFRHSSLEGVLTSLGTAEARRKVQKNDIVLHVLQYFSGGSGSYNSPIGPLSSGAAMASALNSVIIGNWLQPFTHPSLLAACLILLALGSLMTMRLRRALLLNFSMALGFSLVALGLFSGFGVYISWFLPLLSLLVVPLPLYLIKQIEIDSDLHTMEEHLEFGRDLQSAFFSRTSEWSFDRYKVTAFVDPAYAVSGDWLYSWNDSAGNVNIIIGDMTGKSVQGSIGVASLFAILSAFKRSQLRMGDLLHHVNEELFALYAGRVTSSGSALVSNKDGSLELLNIGSYGWFFIPEGTRMLEHYHNTGSRALGGKVLKVDSSRFDLNRKGVLFSCSDGYIANEMSHDAFVHHFNGLDQPKSINAEAVLRLLKRVNPAPERDDRTVVIIEIG